METKNAEAFAESLMRRVFPIAFWTDMVELFIRPLMERIFFIGAIDELAIHNVALPERERLLAGKCLGWGPFGKERLVQRATVKASTASERLALMGLAPPEGVTVELPRWLRHRMERNVNELMTQDFWSNLTETTRGDMLRIITAGVIDGHSVSRMRKTIQAKIPSYSRTRAEMVARTETTGMLNAGHQASMEAVSEATGGAIEGKVWSTLADDRVRDDHRVIDGQERKLADMFKLGNGELAMYPGDARLTVGQRANCLLPGQLVEGAFDAATRAWYRGPVIKLVMRSGRRLSMTINHSVITEDGLVKACEINVGQKLLSSNAPIDGSIATASASDNVNHKPALIEDVFKAIVKQSAVVCVAPCRSGSEGDFDGDGDFIQGNINIVAMHGALLSDRIMSANKNSGSFSLAAVNMQTSLLPSGGPGKLARELVDAASASDMRSGRSVKPGLRGSLCHADQVGVSSVAEDDAHFFQTNSNSSSGVSSRLRQRQQGLASDVAAGQIFDVGDNVASVSSRQGRSVSVASHGNAHCNQSGFNNVFGASSLVAKRKVRFSIDVSLGDQFHVRDKHRGGAVVAQSLRFGLAADWDISLYESLAECGPVATSFLTECHDRLAGLIAFDEVVEVKHFAYQGWVYDLQTVHDPGTSLPRGWFLVNGNAQKNCRCSTIATAVVDALQGAGNLLEPSVPNLITIDF